MRERNISQERKEYLRKIKKNKISVIVVQFLVLILFIVGWEILANQGIIDSFITSQPSRILNTFLDLSENRTPNTLRSNLRRDHYWLFFGKHFRDTNCHYFMVVSIFIKSIRTIFSGFK